MIKQFIVGALTMALVVSAVRAQGSSGSGPRTEPIQSSEDCIRQVSELGDRAEAKDLPEDTFDRIEDLLTTMEAHCEAGRFDEAFAVARDIQRAIEAE